MDLELAGKVAVVTGASKGIGLGRHPRARRGGRARRRRRAHRRHASRASTGVTAVALDLAPPEAPAARSGGARSTSTAGSTCSSTTWAPSACGSTGFLGTSDEEFEWAMQMNFFAALRATRAALAPMLKQRRRRDRQRRLGQRLLPAGRRRHRLRRRQGRARELHASALAQEFGPARHPHQRRLARAGEHRPLARRGRRRRDGRRRPPASTPTRPARRSSPAWAASPPAASRRPRRSRRSW